MDLNTVIGQCLGLHVGTVLGVLGMVKE